MSYPGNPSLSTAVKDRIVSTFTQTLALYKQGRTDEVLQGCTLLLQMDPLFDPAKKLLEKARNPMLPLDVDALMPKSDADALQQAREAMAQRDFQRVLHITTEILTNDLMNDEARVLGDEAREKLEAAPFIEQFVKKCDQALAAGNAAAARADLEKARQLDATHPEVVRIGRQLAGGAAAPAAAPAQSSTFGAGSPSFVVDTPAPAGRGTAQAADFGFTFEEDKKPADTGGGFGSFSFESPAPAAPVTDFSNFSFGTPAPSNDAPFAGGFSFDSPAPAAPAAPAAFSFDAPAPAAAPMGGFDFSTASMETSPDDQRKIEQYLTDGDRALEGGDYQQAIDLWSRIFLIDVTNEQASERIERAKSKRREIEQKVEGILASAVQSYERGDYDTARTRFAEVQRVDPHNQAAQDYMDRLTEATEGGAAGVTSTYAPPPPEPPMDLFDEELPSSREEVSPEDDEGADVAQLRQGRTTKTAATKKTAAPAAARKTPTGLIAAILAAVLLLGGGWYVWSNFMNDADEQVGDTSAVFARASSLGKAGKYDQAILLLQDIKPTDPQHDRALEMIAEFQAKKSSAAQMIDGRPAAVFYQEQLALARQAFDSHDYVAAKAAWEQAMRVQPQLPPDIKPDYDVAAQQVQKLASAKTLFAERKYADALTSLAALQAQDPENQNIRRMIIDAHFNVGATALQEERMPEAIAAFGEVLKLNPEDELAKRSRELAERYNGQPKDLLYRIYVKYLPLRQAIG
jgi:tetratricopeptide (TPR) repeat protein